MTDNVVMALNPAINPSTVSLSEVRDDVYVFAGPFGSLEVLNVGGHWLDADTEERIGRDLAAVLTTVYRASGHTA